MSSPSLKHTSRGTDWWEFPSKPEVTGPCWSSQGPGGEKYELFKPEFLKIRYYDSLTTLSKPCWQLAKQIIKRVLPDTDTGDLEGHGMKKFMRHTRESNTSQTDGFSCGYFLLHYWEGEVRRHAGEGWVVGRALPDKIKKIKDRLINVSKDVEEFKKKILSKKVKESDEVDSFKQLPNEGPRSPGAENFQKFLKDEASRSLAQALVPFYGCSRCRNSRKGCSRCRYSRKGFSSTGSQ